MLSRSGWCGEENDERQPSIVGRLGGPGPAQGRQSCYLQCQPKPVMLIFKSLNSCML